MTRFLDIRIARHGGLGPFMQPNTAWVLLLASALLGCTAEEPAMHRVAIRGFQYAPDTVSVRSGDTVTWINEDIVPHTATAKDEGVDSGAIEATKSWQLVAKDPGTIQYVCAFHPTMKATLVVRDR